MIDLKHSFVAYGDGRQRARVICMQESYFDSNMERYKAQYDNGLRLRKAIRGREGYACAMMATPSQFVLVERLSAVAKHNLSMLQSMANSLVPNQITEYGYITPYRYTKFKSEQDYIFVVKDVPRKRKGYDSNRETIDLWRAKKLDIDETLRRFHTYQKSREDALNSMVTSSRHNSNRVYLDRLTKKEKEKFAILRLAPSDVYIEDIGGKTVQKEWGDYKTYYMLLGDK